MEVRIAAGRLRYLGGLVGPSLRTACIVVTAVLPTKFGMVCIKSDKEAKKGNLKRPCFSIRSGIFRHAVCRLL